MSERRAVVTGAAGLIGREIVRSLRGDGFEVVGLDRVRGDDAEAAEIEVVDVVDPAAVAAAAERLESASGALDALVHAAAMTGRTAGRPIAAPLTEVALDLWEDTLRANLTSALICVQAFAPLLRRSPAPAVVLIGSVQGLVPTLATGAYAVSKTALVGLTRQLAAELAPDGITVNLLAPGPTIEGDDPGVTERTRDGDPTPLGRLGGAHEVGAAVAALVGPAFRNVTGAVVPIDGGEHLRPRGAPSRLGPRTPATATDEVTG